MGLDNDCVYWSNKKVPANGQTLIDGAECVLYPDAGDERKYAVLLENMKIRKQPSSKAEVVTIDGYSSYAGYMVEKRSVEFAGSVLWIKAKSIKEDVIEGKSSPWYYVLCSDELNNFDGIGTFGWIYGGFLKEITYSEKEKNINEYKPLLRKKLKEAGANLND